MDKIVEDDHADVDFNEFIDFGKAAAPLQQHHSISHSYESLDIDQSQPDPNAVASAPPVEMSVQCHLLYAHCHALIADHTFSPASQITFDSTTGDPLQNGEQIDCDFSNVDDLYREKYSSWIPRFYKPDPPCDYCRSRQLDCKVFLWDREGRPNHACLSCKVLFRTCSFDEDSSHTHPEQSGQFDTLHVVTEDQCCETGALTGIKPLFSAGASLEQIMDDFADRKQDKPSGRFSKKIVKILKEWLEEHKNHPYPSEEEKERLKDLTGLTRNQVSNWLANARRRGKCGRQRAPSPSVAPAGLDQRTPLQMSDEAEASKPQPIPVPAKHNDGREDQSYLTPFERWKESPPEHEPASVSAIARAMADTEYVPGQDSGNSSQTPSHADHQRRSSAGGSGFHRFRAPSSTSIELESGISSNSLGSASRSHGSSQGSSMHSFAKRNSRYRTNRKRAVTPIPKPLGPRHGRSASSHSGGARSSTHARPFHCTFCVDTFQTKYDWQRHEKSLHLSLERWMCAPEGPVILDSAGDGTVCAYCGIANPSATHAETFHEHSTCFDKGAASRTFHRKDHLRQHLRLVHSVTKPPQHIDSWKTARTGNGANGGVTSRCGFCNAHFDSWDDRATHLAGHFRAGATMKQWKGGWGFDPEVEACVTEAMPPYLLDYEARSPLPFAAGKTGREQEMSNYRQELQSEGVSHSLSQSQQALHELDQPSLGIASDPNNPQEEPVTQEDFYILFSQALAQRVWKIQQGESAHMRPLTNAIIQEEARDLTFGSRDDWNQTEADNQAWLIWFKEKTGVRTVEDEADAERNTSGNREIWGATSSACMIRGESTAGIEGSAFPVQSGHGYLSSPAGPYQEPLNFPLFPQDISLVPEPDLSALEFDASHFPRHPQDTSAALAEPDPMPDIVSGAFGVPVAGGVPDMHPKSVQDMTSAPPFSDEAKVLSKLSLDNQNQEDVFHME